MKSSMYLDWFLRLKCAGDLLNLKVFPNTKEITETMGIWNFATRTGIPYNDGETLAFVIGDGCTPRTGAFLAYNTAWSVNSVDPALKLDSKYDVIRRLYLFPTRVEDTTFVFDTGFKNIIVFFPHAHVEPRPVIDQMKKIAKGMRLFCITMECCVDMVIPNMPGIVYKDTAIWSPKNVMVLYDYGVV